MLRLHGLNGALISNQETTGAAGLFEQRETPPIMLQSRVALDEVVLAELKKRSDAGYFGLGQTDLTGPATTGGATLAVVIDGHGVQPLTVPNSHE